MDNTTESSDYHPGSPRSRVKGTDGGTQRPKADLTQSGSEARPVSSVVNTNYVQGGRGTTTSAAQSGGFQLVVNRRAARAKAHVVGTSANDNNELTGVKPKQQNVPQSTQMFITRLAPDTTVDKLELYLLNKLKVKADCYRLDTKYDTYASFKVTVRNKDFKSIMNSNAWPEHVLVRKFYTKQ